jgi:lipopolysaccharide export system ATP-binding protein
MDGRDITKLPMYKRARSGMGYLSQEPSVFRNLTVEDNILLVLELAGMPKPHRMARLEALLREFRIENVRRTRGVRLSGGEARRVEVARALATSPRYLLLDEPFLGVDPITVADIQDMLRSLRDEKGIGILLSDHNVRDTLAISDRAYIMYEGRIRVSGSSEEVAGSPEAREFYLGERFEFGDVRC